MVNRVMELLEEKLTEWVMQVRFLTDFTYFDGNNSRKATQAKMKICILVPITDTVITSQGEYT